MDTSRRRLNLVDDLIFPSRLRAERLRQRLTQSDVAGLFGVTTQTVSKWELGEKSPQPRFYPVLARFLHLDGPEDLALLLRSPGEVDLGAGPSAPSAVTGEDVERRIRLNVSEWLRQYDGPLTTDLVTLARLLVGGEADGDL